MRARAHRRLSRAARWQLTGRAPPLPRSYEIVSEEALDPEGTYVYAAHPHGVFPMAQWLSMPASCAPRAHARNASDTVDAAILRALPTRMRGAAADALLRLPLLRHLLSAAGLAPAGRAALAALLAARTSVVIVPGGIAEIFEARPDEEVLVLRSRKGFVRAALAAGVPLVPIYCFGNTACFRVRPPPAAVRALSRRARVGLLILFWGRARVPVPFRTKLLVAVGPPLAPRPGEGVEALHARYCAALRALFDRHKARLGPDWAAKTLRIT